MKKVLFYLAVSFLAVSCGKNSANISATISGAGDKEVVLQRLDINNVVSVDTVKTNKNGNLSCKIKFADNAPQFYYLSYNNRRIASMIVMPKDNITITADTLGNYNVNGSKESALLKRLDSSLVAVQAKYSELAAKVGYAVAAKDEEAVKTLRQDMGRLYVKYKQGVMKQILGNPYSFSNIPALYQNFSANLPLFAEFTDGLIFKRVYDSLVTRYPHSAYVMHLKKEADAFDKRVELEQKLLQAGVSSFPNVSLPDINSKSHELRELEGRPFILYFWGAADVNQKLFNNQLKDIYAAYNPKGLEIYQVSVDTDKAMWATAVKEQQLPWINVCDGASGSSQAVIAYNITAVPSLFIFDKEGNIVARDIFNDAKLKNILNGICK